MQAKDGCMLFQLKKPGRSLADWALFSLMGLLVMLAVFAIGRAAMVQERVAHTFEGWYDDVPGYQKALAEQKTTEKPMLVYFYANWCPYCKRFTSQILSTSKVQNYVKRFPHVRIAPDNGRAERQLMESFGAEGFPAFYVLKPDGERTKIETHIQTGEEVRLKKPDEFIADVEKAAR
jgi:thiol:disulfide interchange protein